MTTPELVLHLLGRRHRLPDGVIIDCLALAAADITGRKIQVEEMGEILSTLNRSNTSFKLSRLNRLGLLFYERGTSTDPGYTILRVGPTILRVGPP